MNPPRVYTCFPILKPPPTSLPVPYHWVIPVHQPQDHEENGRSKYKFDSLVSMKNFRSEKRKVLYYSHCAMLATSVL